MPMPRGERAGSKTPTVDYAAGCLVSVSVLEEARKHTLDAMRVLSELMQRAKSDSVRLNAAEAILSRGWGRPVQAFQVDGQFANRKLNELTNEELAAFEKRLANAEPQ
jgi:hypothetical protein